jgi:hypothetical protein
MWGVIHMCVEATQGISLYSYLYLKLEKMPRILFSFYVFSSTKSENKKAEEFQPGGRWWVGGGEPNNVYTCK